MSENKILLNEAVSNASFGAPGRYDLIVRQDKAEIIHEETPLKFTGVLDSPFVFLSQRLQMHLDKSANIVVDRDQMTIVLTTEERSDFKNIITGGLTFHPSFVRLGINDGKFVPAKDLADRLRKNKAFFETLLEATEVISKLQSFKAQVIKTIEKSDDKRGNAVDLKAQAIDSINLPKNFKLKAPIFKGQPAVEFSVEIEVQAEDLTVTLFSEEAFTIIDQCRDAAIDEVLNRIREIAPGIVILEK